MVIQRKVRFHWLNSYNLKVFEWQILKLKRGNESNREYEVRAKKSEAHDLEKTGIVTSLLNMTTCVTTKNTSLGSRV